MKYYLDITLLPNEEIPIHFLWEKVYQQLHLALVEQAYESDEIIFIRGQPEKIKKSKVGIAFPKYSQCGNSLCDKIRLLSLEKKDLEDLDLNRFCSRLEDYVHQTRIKEVPVDKITGYAFFKRVTVKGNKERLARRRTKRLQSKGMETNYEQALEYFKNDQERTQSEKTKTRAPFVYLQSETTQQRFPLFIEMVKTEQIAEKAEFSCYGLSGESSVPLF